MLVNSPGNTEAEVFDSNFRKLAEYFSVPGKKLVISHCGELSQEKISNISTLVEDQLLTMEVSKGAMKKMFNIVIEALQNILLHGEKDGNGVQHCYIVIGQDESELTIFTGNLVSNINVERMRQRLEGIKSLDEKALKGKYMEVLSNGELSAKGGAGLGFLTIALKSGNNIKFDFRSVNDSVSLFSLQSKVPA
jgi:anti-sigma regulatory factor (Ser/Thr protein kinase)